MMSFAIEQKNFFFNVLWLPHIFIVMMGCGGWSSRNKYAMHEIAFNPRGIRPKNSYILPSCHEISNICIENLFPWRCHRFSLHWVEQWPSFIFLFSNWRCIYIQKLNSMSSQICFITYGKKSFLISFHIRNAHQQIYTRKLLRLLLSKHKLNEFQHSWWKDMCDTFTEKWIKYIA